jgi:hypothetical protein
MKFLDIKKLIEQNNRNFPIMAAKKEMYLKL